MRIIDEDEVGLKEKTEGQTGLIFDFIECFTTTFLHSLLATQGGGRGPVLSGPPRANDWIPNWTIMGNCRLENGQGHHSLKGPGRG